MGFLFNYISHDMEDSLRNFVYKSGNKSITYNYLVSPLCDLLVLIFPKWLAPNILTVGGFFLNLVSFAYTYLKTPDFNKEVDSSVAIVFTVCFSLYYLLDNCDGKQARRTGSSSPVGLLLDHGCDIVTTCLVVFNLLHICDLGDYFYFYWLSSLLILEFFFVTYQEYVEGYLDLGYFNGVDDGGLLLIVLGTVISIWGDTPIKGEMFSIFGWKLTLIDLFLIGLTAGFLFDLCICFYKICQKTGIFSIFSFLIDFAQCALFLLFPLFHLVIRGKDDHQEHFNYYFVLSSLLVSKMVFHLQICCVTRLKFNSTSFLLNHVAVASCLMAVELTPNFLAPTLVVWIVILCIYDLEYYIGNINDMNKALGINFWTIPEVKQD